MILLIVFQIKTVVFDKTGTLTHGKPKVVATKIFADSIALPWKELLAVAGTAEMNSEHPLGVALKDYVIDVSRFADELVISLIFTSIDSKKHMRIMLVFYVPS